MYVNVQFFIRFKLQHRVIHFILSNVDVFWNLYIKQSI